MVGYHDHAIAYGLASVAEAAIKWLLVNLLMHYNNNPEWLRTISTELMAKLINHEDICLVQTECAMYYMLRFWMYMRVRFDDNRRLIHIPDANGNDDYYDDPHFDDMDADENVEPTSEDRSASGVLADSNSAMKFFSIRSRDTYAPFLKNPLGVPFKRLFQQLRYDHMMYHPLDLEMLYADNIVPVDWLHPPLLRAWNAMLNFDLSMDVGCSDYETDTFLSGCNRCGRYLATETAAGLRWRWTGFSYGLDLVMVVERRSLLIRRNHRADHERMLSLQPKRRLMIR